MANTIIASGSIDTVVFDVGAVLLEWNPRHLYRKMFDAPARMEWFLTEVCSPAWNLAQDAGRPWPEAEAEAIGRHPSEAEHIRAYRARWHEMVPHAYGSTVQLLQDLASARVPLYAITNFAADTLAESRQRFPFFSLFKGIVCSGELKILKPDPRIYRNLADIHGIRLDRCVFLDDSLANCDGARAVGMQAIHFTSADAARASLARLGFPGLR